VADRGRAAGFRRGTVRAPDSASAEDGVAATDFSMLRQPN